MRLTKEQIAILDHTKNRAAKGFYCGDSPDMQKLVEYGLMESAGRKSFVPEEYFKLTDKGRDYLKNRMWCRDCKQWFEVDPNIPLDEQVSEEHTWTETFRSLRHITEEEYREARADAQLCRECGAYPCACGL